jgi:hypothetical protein
LCRALSGRGVPPGAGGHRGGRSGRAGHRRPRRRGLRRAGRRRSPRQPSTGSRRSSRSPVQSRSPSPRSSSRWQLGNGPCGRCATRCSCPLLPTAAQDEDAEDRYRHRSAIPSRSHGFDELGTSAPRIRRGLQATPPRRAPSTATGAGGRGQAGLERHVLSGLQRPQAFPGNARSLRHLLDGQACRLTQPPHLFPCVWPAPLGPRPALLCFECTERPLRPGLKRGPTSTGARCTDAQGPRLSL